jgi:hypothetical protein
VGGLRDESTVSLPSVSSQQRVFQDPVPVLCAALAMTVQQRATGGGCRGEAVLADDARTCELALFTRDAACPASASQRTSRCAHLRLSHVACGR